MPLTKKENDEVLELVCDIVNDSDPDQEYENPLCHENLFNKLDRLRLKYGELARLLGLRADFTDSNEERVELYERAIKISEKSYDYVGLTQSAESLTQIYIDDKPDFDKALFWYEKLEKWVAGSNDESILMPLSEIKAQIHRLKIKSV
jgi:hypothetical protein